MQEHTAPSPEDVAETAAFTALEAAACLGVHERTVRRAIAQGTLVASRRGNAFSITPEALERFRRQRQTTPPAPASQARSVAKPRPNDWRDVKFDSWLAEMWTQ